MGASGEEKPGQLIPRSTRSNHCRKDAQISPAIDKVSYSTSLFFPTLLMLVIVQTEAGMASPNQTSAMENENEQRSGPLETPPAASMYYIIF